LDNLCHTLVGAALGEAGLKRRTRWGSATLMIAGNLPDIDVLVFASSTPAISFRRGWTHGIVAQIVLPIALTAAVWLVDRMARALSGRRSARSPDARISVLWLLLLSYAGIYSHVLLDYLNNYGVRLLAPLDWRWLYGDAVFIVDPWLWLALGAGVWLSLRRRATGPARGALVFTVCYALAMLWSARAARESVIRTWTETRGQAPIALMVGPQPITPLTRDVIVDAGDRYETATFSWIGPTVTFDRGSVPKNNALPAVRLARETEPMRHFLTWSRFPFWTVTNGADGDHVTVGDMRFAGFGALRVAGGAARFTATVTVPSSVTNATPSSSSRRADLRR
jgi:inner membrane protein